MTSQNKIYLSQMKALILSITNIEDEAWLAYKRLFSPQAFKKGMYFAETGEYPTDLAFVASGVFRAFYRNESGVEYNKTFFCKNTLMAPLSALVLETENFINLQALVDSDLLVANYKGLTHLYDNYPCIERFARKIIEIEWCKKEERELRLVLNSAEERYDHFLKEHPELENQIPQYHIASYLGITPVALSRIRANRIKK